jgi:hypothetical protein
MNGEFHADLPGDFRLATTGILILLEQVFDLAVISLEEGDGVLLFSGHGSVPCGAARL